MRLFIAVNFDEEIKRRILAVQARIKENTKGGKFSPPENLHLTLVFLGETPEERLPEVKDAIVCSAQENGKPVPSFKITLSDTGFFKRGRKELWWLGTDAKEKSGNVNILGELQRRLAAELMSRKFFIDSRPFTAHITLGREINSNFAGDNSFAGGNGLWPFKTEKIIIPVKRLSLMQSLRKPMDGKRNVLVYTELFGFDLAYSADQSF